MSEVLSVQGQLVGIPVEKYTGVSGIVVDPVNKTIRPDETVLWTDSTPVTGTGQSFTLSEAYTNFEKLKFVLRLDDSKNEVELYTDIGASFGIPFNSASDTYAWQSWMIILFTNTTTASITKTKTIGWTFSSTSTTATELHNNWEWCCRALKKIVGINRKA